MPVVLMVEPKANQRLLYRMELEDAGYRVRVAGTAEEAVSAVVLHQPDLVVLEPHRGVGDEEYPLGVIRAADAHVPVIVYTGYAGTRYAASHPDIEACLVKCSDLEPLKQQIRVSLARSGRWAPQILEGRNGLVRTGQPMYTFRPGASISVAGPVLD